MGLQDRIEANLQRIRSEMAEAALRGGRTPEAVRLVAVTKTVDMETVRVLVALGQRDLGENRAEQLVPRAAEAASMGLDVAWHMIGHLQRRKVRDLLLHVAMIHGVDSLRLAREIDKRAEQAGLGPVPVLLEVNVAGEEQKYGIRPEEADPLAREVAALPRVDLRGLMTMAPLTCDAERARPVFAGLRGLLERLNAGPCASRPLAELSMGMSQDYRVAVEEGATLVRIGTALFE